MKVTKLAYILNVTPNMVFYCTGIKHISPVKSPKNGYKSYGRTVQQLLTLILSSKQLVFSVEALKEILIEAEKHFQAVLLLREKRGNAISGRQTKLVKVPKGYKNCHLIDGDSDE